MSEGEDFQIYLEESEAEINNFQNILPEQGDDGQKRNEIMNKLS